MFHYLQQCFFPQSLLCAMSIQLYHLSFGQYLHCYIQVSEGLMTCLSIYLYCISNVCEGEYFFLYKNNYFNPVSKFFFSTWEYLNHLHLSKLWFRTAIMHLFSICLFLFSSSFLPSFGLILKKITHFSSTRVLHFLARMFP